MARKRYTAEEVVNKLRHADAEMAQGSMVAGVYKILAISEQTYDAWQRE